MGARKYPSLVERIEARFERRGDDECWPWSGGVNHLGQPCISVKKAGRSARRLYWEHLNRTKLPHTRWVRVTCRNQGCMNPRHMTLRAQQDDVSRFWDKVDTSGGPDACWEWTGTRDRRNYGHFSPLGGERTRQAHRVAWEMTHGPQPSHLFVCHRCDHPPCCNPAHLFLGTALDNTRDMISKGRNARKVTPEMRAEMVRLQAQKVTHRVIAERLGIAPPTVYVYLRKAREEAMSDQHKRSDP